MIKFVKRANFEEKKNQLCLVSSEEKKNILQKGVDDYI